MLKLSMSVFFFLLSTITLCEAEVLVVASSKSKVSTLTSDEVRRVFLGKTRQIKGTSITVVEPQSQGVKKEFYSKIAGKSLAQLRSYWAIRLFSGKGQPPKSYENDQEMVLRLRENPKMIGFVGPDVDVSDLKILYRSR